MMSVQCCSMWRPTNSAVISVAVWHDQLTFTYGVITLLLYDEPPFLERAQDKYDTIILIKAFLDANTG